MTLEGDLATWIATRPDWQRAAVARFCRNEDLTPEDVTDIADHLIAGTYPATEPIAANEVPGSSESGLPVRLVAVADVAGVNALLPEQEVTFGQSGLTIVYGDNASGKSGYARLIREAVTARIKADVLGNVFAKEHSAQSASVRYLVGEEAASWALGGASHQALSSVRFYDEMCGDAYVTSASEISYRPSTLTLLDRLSRACDQVQRELARRLLDNAQTKPQLPLLADGTGAKAFLTSLSATTTQDAIDKATSLSPDHDQTMARKLQEEGRLKGSDPTKEKTRLAHLADGWRTVRTHVDRLADALTVERIEGLKTDRHQAASLRQAAKIASASTFEAEPLGGVGSATWRALWNAARDYSLAEAYHDHDFPVVTGAAACVLCQQPLTAEGADRLTRFQAFVTDTTSRDADKAERQLAGLRDGLALLQSQPSNVTAALGLLQAGGESISEVQTWISESSSIAEKLVRWIDGAEPDAPTAASLSPSAGIEVRREALTAAADAIDSSTFNESLRTLSAEIADLQSRAALSAAKANLAIEVERLKARARIERAKTLTDTTGITRKSTDLTTTYVTSLVRDQFTRETDRLHLLRVTIDPTGGRKNVTLEHKPKLLGATVAVDIDDVLSEGEQTALGLAGFFTEVFFDDSKSAIVLDDPVSSLDAGRRSRVAKRLVELARDRQVIVFTHEATFVTALNKTARDLGVDVTERGILRQGDQPGKASDKHPWNVKDTRARIDWLDVELGRLHKERSQLDSDEV